MCMREKDWNCLRKKCQDLVGATKIHPSPDLARNTPSWLTTHICCQLIGTDGSFGNHCWVCSICYSGQEVCRDSVNVARTSS